MPYKNAYNKNIAADLRQIDQNYVNRVNSISDTNRFAVTSQLESAVAKYPDHVEGGSGYAAATIQDLGYEPTQGATSATRRSRARRQAAAKPEVPSDVVGEGLEAGGVSGGGVSGGGVSGGGVSGGGVSGGGRKRSRKSAGIVGGALLTDKDAMYMQGQPPDTIAAKITLQAAPHKDQPIGERSVPRIIGSGVSGGGSSGGGNAGSRSARNHLVREVMQKHGLSLPAASKYIKEHNLYKS